MFAFFFPWWFYIPILTSRAFHINFITFLYSLYGFTCIFICPQIHLAYLFTVNELIGILNIKPIDVKPLLGACKLTNKRINSDFHRFPCPDEHMVPQSMISYHYPVPVSKMSSRVWDICCVVNLIICSPSKANVVQNVIDIFKRLSKFQVFF